ncbi:MAG: lysophospholipid acyltransferase family protein [Clostridia bacterium]|jgi:1-acyl-sn-glycerol-3-phosphate acyltransferase|nr:1-acyl-sn-glycerol-3-phosphate acyltransferase [Clostridia bacterium]MDD4502402.1 lysophospholipid acyltransferase family protein [Clostridia bacterium]HQM96827.1 lysophospholipid acyltransferase family protein [Clostridia bacterium]
MNTDMQNNTENSDPLEEHVLHFWQPYTFKTEEGYDYLRRGFFKRLTNTLLRIVVAILFNPLNRIILGLKVEGRENIRKVKHKGYVFITNHVHAVDCTFIDCLIPFKRLYYVTLESNFQIPVVRHLIRILNAVPIPSRTRCIKEFLDNMDKAIAYGSVVCMYPECYLLPYYKGVRKFKKGAFHIAIKNKCPILPMVVTFREPDGIFRYIKKKPCVTLTVLEPVYTENMGTAIKDEINLMETCHTMMKSYADSMHNL